MIREGAIKQSTLIQRLEINLSEETKKFLLEALKQEPRKGEWITNKLGMFECTACNTMTFAKQKDWSFCPYCGADMRGD